MPINKTPPNKTLKQAGCAFRSEKASMSILWFWRQQKQFYSLGLFLHAQFYIMVEMFPKTIKFLQTR